MSLELRTLAEFKVMGHGQDVHWPVYLKGMKDFTRASIRGQCAPHLNFAASKVAAP